MSNQEFRFEGSAPQGKFEYICCCGQQEFNKEIFGSSIEVFECTKCGTKYTIRNQRTHWHLTITRN